MSKTKDKVDEALAKLTRYRPVVNAGYPAAIMASQESEAFERWVPEAHGWVDVNQVAHVMREMMEGSK